MSAEPTITTADLDYPLPEDRIATQPAEPRDSARLLVVHRHEDRIEHRTVRDLPDYVRSDDVMIFNRSAVIPARLVGSRASTGGRVEGLFLQQSGPDRWLVMLRGRGRLRPGQTIDLLDAFGAPGSASMELIESRGDGQWLVRLESNADSAHVLESLGRTPLPPYILKARGDVEVDDALDRRWYQTVYADERNRGSVAAPTAGLHFTPELLSRLERCGVRRRELILHVGPGTFKPITSATLAGHVMHNERFEVPSATLVALREWPRRGRTIAVGTTTVRALESLPEPLPDVGAPYQGETELLIAPPYRFRHVDALMTNFHLPRSTLLALVAAFIGLKRLKKIYAEAVERGYRFYSYGDAMFIV